MAIAGLTGPEVASASDEQAQKDAQADVRLEIHDASRLEWSVSLPLPTARSLTYSIEVEMDIPANACANHSAWDQLQSFTRLDGGQLSVEGQDASTIDSLRNSAIAVASELAREGEAFGRRCLVAASLFNHAASEGLRADLARNLDAAVSLAEDARQTLVPSTPRDAVELTRERRLVDEFISVRLLAMLAGAEHGLSVLQDSRAPQAPALSGVATDLGARIAEVLERELTHRQEAGYICADAACQATLEAYLERASGLKKHFQGVLFLEADVIKVAEKLHHWAAGLGALIASTWAFLCQMALSRHAASSATTLGSGLFMVAIVAGLIYATKDRVKEVGRTWISGNVHRFYAQRVARYRAPARRLPGQDVVVTARESFETKLNQKPDPLNPESGSLVHTTMIRYSHKGHVLPTPALTRGGVRRVKHVFRYDLSPLFARLDDAVKHVPVLDKSTHRVRFTKAPRSYRFPVTIRVSTSAGTTENAAMVVLHKGGLDRLERAIDFPADLSLAGL